MGWTEIIKQRLGKYEQHRIEDVAYEKEKDIRTMIEANRLADGNEYRRNELPGWRMEQ
jgi:hypothetical protein